MNTLLDIKHVSFDLPYLDKPILTNVSYKVQQNDFVILLGSNGSGKSSLLKLIDQRYEPTQGEILLDDKPLFSYSNKAFSKQVVTLTQNCNESLFTSLTLFENFRIIKQQHEKTLFSRNKSERTFFKEYLKNFNPNLPNKLDQIVEQLSGGEKQALALALAVLYPPRILLLDEHTSALDPKSAEQLMALTATVIKEKNITCVLTTHDLSIALKFGNKLLALRQGTINLTLDETQKKRLNQKDIIDLCY